MNKVTKAVIIALAAAGLATGAAAAVSASGGSTVSATHYYG